MARRLKTYTFVCGKWCITETDYKGYKIYKVRSHGIEYYSILKKNKDGEEHLYGLHGKLKYAKKEVDKWEQEVI